jgi:hypothetical protein
LRKP